MKKFENFIVSVFSGENTMLNAFGCLVINVVVVFCFISALFLTALILLK